MAEHFSWYRKNLNKDIHWIGFFALENNENFETYTYEACDKVIVSLTKNAFKWIIFLKDIEEYS